MARQIHWVRCKGEVSTEKHELDVTTISEGVETKNTELVEQSIEYVVGAMTTSVKYITVNGVDSPAVKLIML